MILNIDSNIGFTFFFIIKTFYLLKLRRLSSKERGHKTEYFLLFNSSSFSDNENIKGIDPELAELLMVEKQKAQFNAQVNIYHSYKSYKLIHTELICIFNFISYVYIYVHTQYKYSCVCYFTMR